MPATVQVALCTCPDQATAEHLGESLVHEGLAACVNILPGVVSIYRWEGAVVKDNEVLMLIKTTKGRTAEVVAYIEREHPYDVPEVIAYPIVAGLDSYMEWVRKCTTKQD
ncbi:MAG: divalent-cation tolerance protein CutA [Thiohalocapsa sp.]